MSELILILSNKLEAVMARIGAEKKAEIRNKILEVSKELFISKGYENTSTSEIAKSVGIAEGTVFNYFKTKSEIYMSILSVSFINIEDEALAQIDFTTGVVDIFMELIEKTGKKILILPKRVLIEMGAVMINVTKSKPNLLKKMAEIDFKFMDQVYEIIIKLQETGAIKPCDARILSESVYSAFMYEFMMYVYEKERTIDEMHKRIREKLVFICKGYV